jgi:hypothetical protein
VVSVASAELANQGGNADSLVDGGADEVRLEIALDVAKTPFDAGSRESCVTAELPGRVPTGDAQAHVLSRGSARFRS